MIIKSVNFSAVICAILFIAGCASTPPSVLVSNPDVFPVYPGCESVGQSQMKQCFSRRIGRFFRVKVDTDVVTRNNLEGKLRSVASFVVDEAGEINLLGVTAPHPALEVEITRVANELPVSKPGVYKGKAVSVPFKLPISLIVN